MTPPGHKSLGSLGRIPVVLEREQELTLLQSTIAATCRLRGSSVLGGSDVSSRELKSKRRRKMWLRTTNPRAAFDSRWVAGEISLLGMFVIGRHRFLFD